MVKDGETSGRRDRAYRLERRPVVRRERRLVPEEVVERRLAARVSILESLDAGSDMRTKHPGRSAAAEGVSPSAERISTEKREKGRKLASKA